MYAYFQTVQTTVSHALLCQIKQLVASVKSLTMKRMTNVKVRFQMSIACAISVTTKGCQNAF